MTTEERQLLDFVAAQAAERLPDLPVREKIQLLEGLMLIVPISEREQCAIAVKALRQAEAAQLIFIEMVAEKRELHRRTAGALASELPKS